MKIVRIEKREYHRTIEDSYLNLKSMVAKNENMGTFQQEKENI